MREVIAKELAVEELDKIIDFYEVDPEGKSWEESRAQLLRSIQRGRLEFDADAGEVILHLVRPIEKENGETVSIFRFHEPTAGDLKVMDRYKEGEKMAQTIHLASKMTGQPIGLIERMASRDLSAVGSVSSLFF